MFRGCQKLMLKNLIYCWIVVLDWIAQKKGFDALNATQKISALCTVLFLKKNQEKTDKNDNFWPF